MITVAMLALALSASEVATANHVATLAAQDPPVRVWLNKRDAVERGDRIRVHVETDEDGYLVVLHADPEGRVRMLLPVDPTDDHFIRGGREYEVRNRGDRHAFTVHESAGLGTVYAAYSRDPFRFDGLVRGTHWDYALQDAWRVVDDVEGELTALVEQMVTGASFDYDLVYYDVYSTVAYTRRYRSVYGGDYYDPFYCDVFYCSPFYLIGRRGYRPGIHIGIGIGFGFGRPYYHRPIYYDPFYDPFYYDPFYYDPFYYGFGYGFPYRSYYGGYYYPRGTVYVGYPRTYRNRGFTFKSPSRSFVESVGVRRRPGSATTLTRRATPTATTASTRRTPADVSRRSTTTIGESTRARTPSNATPTRVRTPTSARDASGASRATVSRREIDVRSRRGLQVTEQRGDDGQSRRHYEVRIRGGNRTTSTPSQVQERGTRRPAATAQPESRSRSTTRALRPSESSRARAIQSTPRTTTRSQRSATPQRSNERRSISRPSPSRSATRAAPRSARSPSSARSAPRRSTPRVRASRPAVRSSPSRGSRSRTPRRRPD
jgi:hypothetical protein